MRRFLVALKRSERPAARIVCFPYAGGHAAYASSWSQHLPNAIELFGVGYPGGQDPQAQPLRSVQDIAACVLQEVLAHRELPLILFGYSLGALVAYEVSVALARRAEAPAELLVAARSAPHLTSDKEPMAQLPDTQFIARLRELGGTPQAVLDNPEILSFFLPLLRADIASAESYRPGPQSPLDCPISAITGTADATTRPEAVAAWKAYTTADFRLHRLEGHHFFLHQHPQAVIDIVLQAVRRHVLLPVS